jgi:hypothetical protein
MMQRNAIPIFGIAVAFEDRHGDRIVNAKKNAIPAHGTPAPAKVRAIRLRPSSSDYETFAMTTALAMGKTASTASTRKPNTRLLSLLNLGS